MTAPDQADKTPSGERSFPRDATTLLAVQRNHLANERTFLAWCRTAMAFFVFGFVLLRFDFALGEAATTSVRPSGLLRALADARLVGAGAFVVGALVLVLAAWRFFTIRRRIATLDLTYDSLPDTLVLVFLVALVGGMAALVSLVLVS